MRVIYQMGDMNQHILPSQAAITKLKELLEKAEGSFTEIIWGPDLEWELVPENMEEVEKLTEYFRAKNNA